MIDRRGRERSVGHGGRNDRTTREVNSAGEERFACVAHERVIGIVDRPFDLGVDNATWQLEIALSPGQRPALANPTDWDPPTPRITDPLTLPAIRSFDRSPVLGKGFQLLSDDVFLRVGDGRRQGRPRRRRSGRSTRQNLSRRYRRGSWQR